MHKKAPNHLIGSFFSDLTELYFIEPIRYRERLACERNLVYMGYYLLFFHSIYFLIFRN